MLNIGQLTQTVQTNCHISDARYAGNYSLCIFLLKMREYYRWENQIPLSQRLEKTDVGDWLSQRELSWANYEDLPYQPLALDTNYVDPFDTQAVNEVLVPHGYVYSGGHGVFHKPHFFLGKLEQTLKHEGLTIFIVDCEYARDLVAPPAMIMGDYVFIRKESLRRIIWEKIEEWLWKKEPHTPMAKAMAYYLPDEGGDVETDVRWEHILDQLIAKEINSVILHEVGEAKASEILGAEWQNMLSELPRSTVEFQLRAVKDHFADTLTTLPSMIQSNDSASLHFYFANFTGIRREIFPEALQAYQHWSDTGNLDALARTINESKHKWEQLGKRFILTYKNDYRNLAAVVDQSLKLTQS
jgi:hypothetical protein